MSKAKQNKTIFPTLDQLKKAGNNVYALIYCRVSSERQKNEGHGLESQEQRCREFAERNGYIVDGVFAEAVSGGGEYTSRPMQVGILDYIDKNPHKNFVVIIDDISRIARDVTAHFQIRYALRDRGVEIVSPNFNFENSPEGEMVEGVMAMVSQYHRKGNKRQVIQKQKARLEAGYWAFASKKPYKMTKDQVHGNILIPEYPMAQLLKEAMEGFASGRFTRKIDACRFLVEMGYWKNQKPERYIDNLTELFKDVLFAGYIEYPEWGVERRIGHHEALISLDVYETIQKRMKREGLNKSIRKDVSDDFPLRGLLCCAYCNKPLTGAWSTGRNQKYPYYFCQNKDCKYKQKSILKKDIEDKFDEVLKKQSMKAEVGILTQEVFGFVWEEEILEIKNMQQAQSRSKNEMKEKFNNLTNLIIKAKSEAMRDAYEKQAEEVVNNIKELNDEIHEDLDFSSPYRTVLCKAVNFLEHPNFIWSELSTKEQQDMFYFIFTEKLPYDIKEGYRTENIPSAVRLFEEFSENNILCTPDVEITENEWNQILDFVIRWYNTLGESNRRMREGEDGEY